MGEARRKRLADSTPERSHVHLNTFVVPDPGKYQPPEGRVAILVDDAA